MFYNDVFIDDSIEKYIDLYNTGININQLEPLKNETYKILMLANTDVRIISREDNYDKLVRLEKIKYFINDHSVFNKVTKQKEFTTGNKYFYMIPVQTLSGTIVGFIFRNIVGKKNYVSVYKMFENQVKKVPLMYGFYKDFDDYNSHEIPKPIIVCEGIKDCIFLKQFYPYVLSNNTSKLGASIYVLQSITNKIILCYDNEHIGEESTYNDKKELSKLGVNTSILKLDEGIKDPAEYINSSNITVDNFKRRLLKTLKDIEEI